MRRGSHPEFITNSEWKFLGINLSADYCAEHEWGIKDIKKAFGINSGAAPGIDRRLVTKVPEKETPFATPMLEFSPIGKEHFLLIYTTHYSTKPTYDKKWLKGGELFLPEGQEISAAWDEKSFGVATTKTNRDKLKELFDAIMNKNVVIGLFGRQVFNNAGLMILIADRIDQKILDLWKESDEDADRLAQASLETGIKQKIDAANDGKDFSNRKHGYYALSPAWIHEADKSKTKYPVKYWLNPQDQQNNQYGWYVVEELEQWLEGRGPILEMRK